MVGLRAVRTERLMTDTFLYVTGQSHRSRSVSVSLDRATDRYLTVTGQSQSRSTGHSVSVYNPNTITTVVAVISTVLVRTVPVSAHSAVL
jgi:hypothetical protein